MSEETREYITVVERRRDELFAELDAGYDAIEAAAAQPDFSESELRQWERFWSKLLREYEDCCEQIRRLI